jgi:integrase
MTSNHIKPSTPALKVVFNKVGENLYRLDSTGGYYALLKRGDKQFRRSLKTNDRRLAERRLAELRAQIGNLSLTEATTITFEDVAKRWLATNQHAMKQSSVERRLLSIKTVAPFFSADSIRAITPAHCERWVMERGSTIAPSTFANELDTLNGTFKYAINRGLLLSNPARNIKRRRIIQAKITVPSREQFQQLIAAIRHSDGRLDNQRKAKAGADLVELLAYSGCRLREATALRWSDVDFKRHCITVTGGERGTKNNETRVIPMTSALQELLIRLKAERKPAPTDLISPILDAKKCLRTACRKLKCHQFTHHDFRHFFATTCIESGVDIPTISKWLGHKDGGALAMKVYGHLRQEHSFSMIKRVNFSTEPVANVVPLPEAAHA